MSFVLTSSDYVAYIGQVARRIADSGDYITELDAVTGDGDHWANINLGFEALVAESEALAALPIDKLFQKVGMLMMSKVGGSSGILYGGAYMAASKAVAGRESIGSADLCAALDAMLADMMARGKAQPGYKTMIDALYPAVQAYKSALQQELGDAETMDAVAKAAAAGAESTRDMQAVKGRASYQQNKGVGHLDPGAVTMSYQIETLCGYVRENLL